MESLSSTSAVLCATCASDSSLARKYMWSGSKAPPEIITYLFPMHRSLFPCLGGTASGWQSKCGRIFYFYFPRKRDFSNKAVLYSHSSYPHKPHCNRQTMMDFAALRECSNHNAASSGASRLSSIYRKGSGRYSVTPKHDLSHSVNFFMKCQLSK